MMPWKVPLTLAQACGVASLCFPCIPLPPPPPPEGPLLAPHQTILWGLTLGIVTELFKAGNERSLAPTERLTQRTWLLGDPQGRPLRGGAASALTALMRWYAEDKKAATLASLSVAASCGCLLLAWAVLRR